MSTHLPESLIKIKEEVGVFSLSTFVILINTSLYEVEVLKPCVALCGGVGIQQVPVATVNIKTEFDILN